MYILLVSICQYINEFWKSARLCRRSQHTLHMQITVSYTITIGPVLIAAFNVCVLHFSRQLCIQLLCLVPIGVGY